MRKIEEVAEDIMTLTRIPDVFINEKLNEIAEEILAIDKAKTDSILELLEQSRQGAKDSKDLSKYSAYEQAIDIVKGQLN